MCALRARVSLFARVVLLTGSFGSRFGGREKRGDAFELSWKKFQKLAFEDVDFDVHIGNEQFLGGILQCQRFEGFAAIGRSGGQRFGGCGESRGPFLGERLVGITGQFGKPSVALRDFAIDAEVLRGRGTHVFEKTRIRCLIAFATALVDDVAAEGADFGIPFGIQHVESDACATERAFGDAASTDERIAFGREAVP